MSESVAAVVVTYNRKNLLIECLDALRNQTHKPDAIYIIDNNSTDGTPELLYEKEYIPQLPVSELLENQLIRHQMASLYYPHETIQISYIRKYENDGGAGGFYEGMKHAYNQGNEWIWVMDDDVEPLNNAIEELFSWKDRANFIQPTRINTHDKKINWGGIFVPLTGEEYHLDYIQKCLKIKGYATVNVACFEGMFINREIITKIGFPDKRFFIAGDDTLYGFIASLYTDIILIPTPLLKRKIIPQINTKLTSNIFLYYKIRNEFLKMKVLKEYGISFNKKIYFLRILILVLRETFISIINLKTKRMVVPIIALGDGLRGIYFKCKHNIT